MALLDVRDLKIAFYDTTPPTEVVKGISFSLEEGETLGIVGESGSGKTQTALSILHLLKENSAVSGGEILYEDSSVAHASSQDLQRIRGKEISMIFQEPMTALNPVFTVGNQLSEVIRTHMKVSKKEAWKIGIQSLEAVGIPDPEERMKNYPFEMSGGMRQRVLIAIAVACHSKLIIADEPTTALDVTTQAQVMELLLSVVKQYKTSLIVVTHNLGLVSRYAKRIYVMYAGRVVECGTTEDLLTRPKHPYTMGLLKAVPGLDDDKEKDLVPIHGAPPNLARLPEGCYFMPRCPYACDKCRNSNYPEFKEVGERGHFAACHLDIKEGGE